MFPIGNILCHNFPPRDPNVLDTFSDNLREELVNSGITDVIKQLTTHEDEKVQEAAKSLEKYIEELTVER